MVHKPLCWFSQDGVIGKEEEREREGWRERGNKVNKGNDSGGETGQMDRGRWGTEWDSYETKSIARRERNVPSFPRFFFHKGAVFVLQWKETWREKKDLKMKASVFPLCLQGCDFVMSLSHFLCVCVCLCVCACVCVWRRECERERESLWSCGSHVFPYKEWVWEELVRNEQNYSTVTPLFLPCFSLFPFLSSASLTSVSLRICLSV